jgi:Flp pilus assembly protein TadG
VGRIEVRRRHGARGRSEAGMVTAETAVVLPVLLFVLAGAVAAVTVVGAQLRCVDAAREGARAAARGESDVAVSRLVDELAPDGADTRVSGDGDEVRVTVTVRVAPLGPLRLAVPLVAAAVAVREPGSAGDIG